MKVYLAGPEVFLPNAKALGEAKQQLCARHGLEGLYPLDQDVPPFEPRPDWAFAIFEANRALMDQADAVIANMTPFRGLSMDVGTAFEMGYMRGRGALVLGYTNSGGTYLQRAEACGFLAERSAHGVALDPLGLALEDFGLQDNLMMAGAVRSSGFEVLVEARRELTGQQLYSDLVLFERCVEILASKWRSR